MSYNVNLCWFNNSLRIFVDSRKNFGLKKRIVSPKNIIKVSFLRSDSDSKRKQNCTLKTFFWSKNCTFFVRIDPSRGQFHQCSTNSFYVRKFCTQLFCAYVLGLYFTGTRLLAQKLPIECWWNWTSVSRVAIHSARVNWKIIVWTKTNFLEKFFHSFRSAFAYFSDDVSKRFGVNPIKEILSW